MLDYLVTSKVRRRLLRLLWADGASGSVGDFAERACVGFAGAHKELRAMCDLGLAASVRVGGTEMFQANAKYPLADALRALSEPQRRDVDDETQRVRAELCALGAPLFGQPMPVCNVDEAVVRGVRLSHRDGTVASVLPVCLFKQRDVLCQKRLVDYARALHEKRALGFFLDLTTALSGDPRFAEWSAAVRDRRCSSVDYLFLDDRKSARSRAVAERNTPSVARSWGLRMNMDLSAFKSMFEKHARE